MRRFAWTCLLATACVQPVDSQGSLEGQMSFDGVSHSVSGSVRAAVVHHGENAWFALELVDSKMTTSVRPFFGDLCFWMMGHPDSGDVVPSDGVWPEQSAPFTRDQWYCQPPTGQDGLFLGLRCDEPTPTATPEATPTPDEIPNEPTPSEETPTPDVPHFSGVSGSVSVQEGAIEACDRLEIQFTDIEMASTGCGGAFETLHIDSLSVSATVLNSGRDWETGGNSECY